MLAVSTRFVDASISTARLAQRRRDELAKIKREAAEIMEQAKAEAASIRDEAIRILDEARAEAARLMAIESAERPKIADIIKSVSMRTGVSVGQILGDRRDVLIIKARFEAMAMAYKMRPDLSLLSIAREFKKDHTSVLNAVKKMGVWRGKSGQSGIDAMHRSHAERRAIQER